MAEDPDAFGSSPSQSDVSTSVALETDVENRSAALGKRDGLERPPEYYLTLDKDGNIVTTQDPDEAVPFTLTDGILSTPSPSGSGTISVPISSFSSDSEDGVLSLVSTVPHSIRPSITSITVDDETRRRSDAGW